MGKFIKPAANFFYYHEEGIAFLRASRIAVSLTSEVNSDHYRNHRPVRLASGLDLALMIDSRKTVYRHSDIETSLRW